MTDIIIPSRRDILDPRDVRECRRCGKKQHKWNERGFFHGAARCECCGRTTCPTNLECCDCCQSLTMTGSGFTGCMTCLNSVFTIERDPINICNINLVPSSQNGDTIDKCDTIEAPSTILDCPLDPVGTIIWDAVVHNGWHSNPLTIYLTGCSICTNESAIIYLEKTSDPFSICPEGEYKIRRQIDDGQTSTCSSSLQTDMESGVLVVACAAGSGVPECCIKRECLYCANCSAANEVSCGVHTQACCTPGTIRAVTSGTSLLCVGDCITGATESYKLAGTTSINGTHDMAQEAIASCGWRHNKASDHVLTRATKFSLATLRYRATRTSDTNWHTEIFADGGGESVKFFDGNVTVPLAVGGSPDCTTAATANNTLACDLCASPKTAGNSGTFGLTPAGTSVTACGFCTTTPSTISAVIASVTTCTDVCECTNRWKLKGTTAVNRTITLNQVGGSPCVWEGTVAADYLLFDHNTAAATFNISTMRYQLIRTGATTASWEIAGYDGATKRISYAGATSGSCARTAMTTTPTANDCKTFPTASHPTRTCCMDSAANAGIFGSGGSTTFTACP